MEKETERNANTISEQLLKWPIMTDEEFQFIEEKRKRLNEWK